MGWPEAAGEGVVTAAVEVLGAGWGLSEGGGPWVGLDFGTAEASGLAEAGGRDAAGLPVRRSSEVCGVGRGSGVPVVVEFGAGRGSVGGESPVGRLSASRIAPMAATATPAPLIIA